MLNLALIHKEYQNYKQSSLKQGASNPVPQPSTNSPMHRMVLHAMAMTPNKDGETHGTMVIRALTDHLKRITPDIGSIHKDATPDLAPSVNAASSQ